MSRLFGLLCFFAAAVGCRPASVMPTPEEPDIPKPPTDEQTVSVAFLKTLWRGAPTLITGEYRIAGAVVSSDREGNFYKTLVVDDGTAGIEVVLDEEQIFKRFMIHSRVTVRCNGLWLGSRGGTLQLGAEPFEDFQTQRLPRNEIAERLFPDNEFYGEVLPASLSFSELGGQWISRFVAFEGVRFATEERGLGWAEVDDGSGNGDGEDGGTEIPAATDRHLVDENGDILTVRTSRYAHFAPWPLPEGVGRIEGVLEVFNGEYRLVVCDSEKFAAYRN